MFGKLFFADGYSLLITASERRSGVSLHKSRIIYDHCMTRLVKSIPDGVYKDLRLTKNIPGGV